MKNGTTKQQSNNEYNLIFSLLRRCFVVYFCISFFCHKFRPLFIWRELTHNSE